MMECFHITSSRVILVLAQCLVMLGKVNTLAAKQSLTFELPDNQQSCFYEEFTGSQRYIFEYKVLAGGQHDVDASLKSPNGKILYKEIKQTNDVVTFETSWGTYEFCFGNEFSTFSHKTVYFSLKPEVTKTLAQEGGDERPLVNTLAEEELEVIHNTALLIINYQTDYRLNEAKGRHSAENLNKKVQWWSVFEAGIIFVTGVGQVIILRAFFSLQRSTIKNDEVATSGAGL